MLEVMKTHGARRIALLTLFIAVLPTGSFARGKKEQEAMPAGAFRDTIAVPLPASTGLPQVRLRFGAGQLSVKAGERRRLIEGEAEYNNELFRPSIRQEGSRVELTTGDGKMELKEFIDLWSSVKDHLNRWNLRLAPVPMELEIDSGASSTRLDLGGLPIKALRISQSFSDIALDFAKANPVEMDTLSFGGGASWCSLKNLANANAGRIVFQGGGGDFTLDFSGKLRRDMLVKIEAGAGELTLVFPESASVEVETHTGLTVVDIRGTWNKSDRLYRHIGSSPAKGPKIIVEAAVLAGSLRLWAGEEE